LPRLTIALAEAICNCRDAVAQLWAGAEAPSHLIGGATGATAS